MITTLATVSAALEEHGWKAAWLSLCIVTTLVFDQLDIIELEQLEHLIP